MIQKPDLAALFGAKEASTFLGLNACPDIDPVQASSAFIGVPCATPYVSVGPYARNGPSSIRQSAASLTANTDRYNFDINGPLFPEGSIRAVDCGDLPWHGTDFALNREIIRNTVSTVVGKGTIPILIGGDDSVPIPMLDALGDTGKPYTILQIDAHIDWRDEYLGERLGLSSNMRRASEMDHIQTIVQVGARGIGSAYPQDVEDCLSWGVHLIPANQIWHAGVRQALGHIPDHANVAICIDIDGLDPSIAPNTIGRSPGGLSYQHALDLIKGVADKATIAAVNFVEIFPESDIDGQGGITISRLIAATMGIIARQQMARR